MTNELAWDYALGMIKVDGLKPSDDMLEMIEQEKKGEVTVEDIIKKLDVKYSASTGEG